MYLSITLMDVHFDIPSVKQNIKNDYIKDNHALVTQ